MEELNVVHTMPLKQLSSTRTTDTFQSRVVERCHVKVMIVVGVHLLEALEVPMKHLGTG